MTHVPVRTCLACGRKGPKRSFLRLCRDRDGNVIIDIHQRLPGRGAYVCATPACVEGLRRRKALHHGFRTQIPDQAYAEVVAFVRQHDS